MLSHAYYESPVGTLRLSSNGEALTALHFVEKADAVAVSCPVLQEAIRQLGGYFTGTRQEFSLPLAPEGTEFRKRVWQALTRIPYGMATSYQSLASNIGQEKASRAIGNANHHNPIGIIIPCHRVIGKNGKMVGYAGGIWRKEWLLAHEQKHYQR